ncbi:MAG: hypothetical protein ACOX0D_01915 [Sphaerochaeta sp.]
MKRLVTITVIFLLVSLSLTAKSTTQTMWAFGGARFALGSDSDSFLGNPALLASSDRTTRSFILSSGFEDSAESWDFEEPSVNLGVSFIAGRMAFSIMNVSSVTRIKEYTYTGKRTGLFQFDWAFGRQPFYIGFTAQIEALSERSEMTFRPELIWSDYFVATNFSRYEPIDQIGSISFGVSFLLDYSWISMAVTSTKFASSETSETLNISFDSLLKSLGWGMAVETPKYNERNELHLFTVRAAVDIANMGSSEERELRMGTSVTLNLLPTYDISLILGYHEQKGEATDWLGLKFAQGFQNQTLAITLNTVKILIGYEFPTAWYVNKPSPRPAKALVGLRLFL